jgi:hypothetical protein
MCLPCLRKHSALTSAHKLALIALGLCSQCGKNKLDTQRLCRPCQDKHNARRAKKSKR